MKTKKDRSAYDKEWRSKNKERIKELRKIWLSKNPGYHNVWREKNPEKQKILAKKYNNKKTGKNIVDRHSRNARFFQKRNMEATKIKIMELFEKGRPPSFISIILGLPILLVNKIVKENINQ